jgi:uncharacterized protein
MFAREAQYSDSDEVRSMKTPMYHEGARELQERFDTRRLADRLVDVVVRDAFADVHRIGIGRCNMFFLATADAEGRPDCSYKGGMPGFVRVVDPKTLAFPSYDGNGMYRSLGNILVNPHVGLLFIDFESGHRLRVNGKASVHYDDPLLPEFVGAQLIVRVHVDAVFPNCPRYVHEIAFVEHSPYAPREGHTPPVPEWKKRAEYREVLPQDDPAQALLAAAADEAPPGSKGTR